MDLNALKLFVEIVDAGNLSAAARRLQTTRSNVSHRLKAFERALGVQLLRRTTRRVEPTEVGTGIYEHGRSILRTGQQHDSLRLGQLVLRPLSHGRQNSRGPAHTAALAPSPHPTWGHGP